ncbi:hypothetical protein L596_010059 [Steinernema carpocapsae]|uniref:Uncharacterized protein n=1 Tax=Steinernema carpocapsae TaxID=34508 RepID=A0A4U5PHZ8_STECR|nr:hypothetical protein L596_010059 [Steinernema carpocapsae]
MCISFSFSRSTSSTSLSSSHSHIHRISSARHFTFHHPDHKNTKIRYNSECTRNRRYRSVWLARRGMRIAAAAASTESGS